MRYLRPLARTISGTFAAAIALLLCSAAAQAQGTPQISANDLVARAVHTQLKDPGGNLHYMYRLTKQAPERTEQREYVETDDGTIGRLVALNGKALDAAQQQVEAQRISRYVNDKSSWQQRRQKQKEDSDRSNKMLAELPNAFLYQYDGTELGPKGESLVRMTFKPNPNYTAPNRELRVFEGMQGKMWVDAGANRMVRLQANLFKDVDFGWGILGRLYHGGSFEIEQRDLGDGRWEVVKTILNFDGKELMLKTLHIKETETLTDFHRVADKLTLAQGVDMLQKYDPDHDAVAEISAAPHTANGGAARPQQ